MRDSPGVAVDRPAERRLNGQGVHLPHVKEQPDGQEGPRRACAILRGSDRGRSIKASGECSSKSHLTDGVDGLRERSESEDEGVGRKSLSASGVASNGDGCNATRAPQRGPSTAIADPSQIHPRPPRPRRASFHCGSSREGLCKRSRGIRRDSRFLRIVLVNEGGHLAPVDGAHFSARAPMERFGRARYTGGEGDESVGDGRGLEIEIKEAIL